MATPQTTKEKAVITTNDVHHGDDLIGEINAANEVLYDPIDTNTRFLAPGTTGGDNYLKELKFMEEMVTFTIAETSDPNAEIEVPVSVNCETKILKRGIYNPHTLPRKFLNALIAREGKVIVENYKDANGIDQTRTRVKYVPKHNIAILNDPSGAEGMKWFKWQSENA